MPFKDKTSHIHPSAVVVFVPGFGDEYLVEDVVFANSTQEEKDISSIHLMRTVRNQPGTFSIVLMDNRNKFILPDKPEEEVSKLFKASQRKIQEEFYPAPNKAVQTPEGNIHLQPPIEPTTRAQQELIFSKTSLKGILPLLENPSEKVGDPVWKKQLESYDLISVFNKYIEILNTEKDESAIAYAIETMQGDAKYYEDLYIEATNNPSEVFDEGLASFVISSREKDTLRLGSNLGNLSEIIRICNSYLRNYAKVETNIEKSNRQLRSIGKDPDQFKDSPPTATSYKPIGKFFDTSRGNHYEFGTYEQWASFSQYILVDPDTGKSYPSQFVRGKGGVIEERWAFLDDGAIVFISKNHVEDSTFVNSFPAPPADIEVMRDMESFTFNVLPYNGESYPKKFDVKRIANKYLQEIYRDIEEQGEEGFKKGRCKIKPMDRVVIFMTPKFLDDGTFNQEPEGLLIRAFTGVVNSVQQGYNNGVHQITVQGEDVTKYMRISIVNANPALELTQLYNLADQDSSMPINVWGSILKGLTTPEIIRLVTLGSDEVKKKGVALNQKIDGIGFYRFAESDDIPDSVKYDVQNNSIVKVSRNTTGGVAKYDFEDMLGELFKRHSVHIIDPYREGTTNMKGFRPYELSLNNNWSFYQADFKTRRDIAYRAAEDSHFNFYADRYGHIWFHPNRFDMSWILSAKIPEVYIIDEESIISYGFIETDDNIFTSVYASTEPDFGAEGLGELGFYHGSFRDEGAMIRYGQRIFVATNPIINTKIIPTNASQTAITEARALIANSVKAYARSLLQRILAEKYQGQITISGRPELDPGRPVYVPIRNMIYYLETVDTSLDFGQSFQTTLHLSYGRKPWEYLPELLTFSSNDEVYLTDAYDVSL